jgi:Mn2+/Fe2+ NRAMP family transporter
MVWTTESKGGCVTLAFRKFRYSWFVVFCLAAILVIVACNIWQLCCGRCVLNDFLRVPPIGWVLIIANLVAGMVLILVKRRSRRNSAADMCGSCHASLRDTWVYCPNCGIERSY